MNDTRVDDTAVGSFSLLSQLAALTLLLLFDWPWPVLLLLDSRARRAAMSAVRDESENSARIVSASVTLVRGRNS